MEGIVEEEFLNAFRECNVDYFNKHKEEITSEMYCWYYRAEGDLSLRYDGVAGLRRMAAKKSDEEWSELESLGKQLARCELSMVLLDGYLKEFQQGEGAKVMCLSKSDVWPVNEGVFNNLELVRVLSAPQRGRLTECLRSEGKPADRFSLSWYIGYVAAMLDKFGGNETRLGEHLHGVLNIGPTYYKNNKNRYQQDCNRFDLGVVEVGRGMYDEIVKSGVANVG